MRGVCLAIAWLFSPLLAEGQANARVGGTGKADLSIEGEDARLSTGDDSFMFVFGLGVNLTVSDHVGLSLEARYNHAFDVFDESARWIPVTASVVIQL